MNEYMVARKLRRLQSREHLTPILQRGIDELIAKAHKTPTKKAARGAVPKHRRRRRIALLSNQAEKHREWCQLHYPTLNQKELDDRFQHGRPSGVLAQPYPGLANFIATPCETGWQLIFWRQALLRMTHEISSKL